MHRLPTLLLCLKPLPGKLLKGFRDERFVDEAHAFCLERGILALTKGRFHVIAHSPGGGNRNVGIAAQY